MLIGIDASRATSRQKTGTEYYSQEIICALSNIDRKNRYILYSGFSPTGKLADLPMNFQWKIMSFPRLWSQIRLSWEMLWHRPGILFIPAHAIPLIHPRKTIVTIHDLGFRRFPDLYAPAEIIYHNWCLRRAVNHAPAIITISQYTKNDLVQLTNIPEQRVTVTPLACDQNLYNTKPVKLPRKIKNLQPYIFNIGRLEEKKNTLGLLKAFVILRRNSAIKHKLILAGSAGYHYDKIQEYKNTLPINIRRDIVELGYAPEEDLARYMKGADLFCFPSFFEGFGIPLVEAMASGVPVVAANTTAIPEVIGQAGILANPYSPAEIAMAIAKIINQATLRKSLIAKGLQRAQNFSWDKTAGQTLEIIEKTYGRN